MGQPGGELLEPERVHPGLAALVALAVTYHHRPAARIDIGLVQRQRLGDPQATAPEHSYQRPDPKTMATLPGLTHDEDDFLGPGRVRRVLHPFVARRAASKIPRQRGR